MKRYTLIRAVLLLAVLVMSLLSGFAVPQLVSAAISSQENPQSGSVGLVGAIPSPAPTRGATITTPRGGQTFNQTPITIAGTCPSGLLVKIFSNNVFIGSVMCVNGSYSIQADLFGGRNDLVARVFDQLDQPGPDSATVTVNFNDAQFNPLGLSLISLTSIYARRGADPGDQLNWPVILTGGTSPYAISVDWGDNKSTDLFSRQFAGDIDLSHKYDVAGVYSVIVKATDKNGFSAFLQVVAVANGAISDSKDKDKQAETVTRILWEPAALALPLLGVSFWLGQRFELSSLRKHFERKL